MATIIPILRLIPTGFLACGISLRMIPQAMNRTLVDGGSLLESWVGKDLEFDSRLHWKEFWH